MVNTVVQYPTNPVHFFQPLLPGFDSRLSIPITFFSKHVQGRNEYKTVELRSDASDMTWEVTIEDGGILTGGWREFVTAHDLRIGDVIVFRHEGDLVFHVTALGPSCSEIQYVHDNMNCRKWKRKSSCESSQRVSSSLSESRFLKLTVTPSGLKENRLYLPQWFTRVNKMESARGKKITLLDKHGVEWPVNLRTGWGNGSMCLGSGIKQFLRSIGLKTYESFVLELVWEDKTSPPMFKFCSKDQGQDLTLISSQVVNKCELNS